MVWLNIGFVLLYLCLEYTSINPKVYLPYRYGVFVISVQFIYLFSFLNTWYCFTSDKSTVVEHAFYFGCVIAGLFIGTYFNKPGCTNTSILWLALLILTRGIDFLKTYAKAYGIVWIFFGFVLLYFVALKLNAHPEFLASIFSADTWAVDD